MIVLLVIFGDPTVGHVRLPHCIGGCGPNKEWVPAKKEGADQLAPLREGLIKKKN
jgi:hypothetical protein